MPLNVKKIRKLMKGRTAGEIAALMGRSRPQFVRMLRDGYDPLLSSIELLAKALKVKARDLI